MLASAWSFQEETPNFSLRQYLEAVAMLISSNYPAYIYIYMYVYHINIYVYIYIYVCMYVCIYVCIPYITAMGTVFHPPQPARTARNRRPVMAELLGKPTAGKMFRFHVSVPKSSSPQVLWPGSTSACYHKKMITVLTLMFKRTTNCCRAPV